MSGNGGWLDEVPGEDRKRLREIKAEIAKLKKSISKPVAKLRAEYRRIQNRATKRREYRKKKETGDGRSHN